MSWISAIDWRGWTFLAATAVGIILLYFLKLRREPVQVPSTYLWSRTIEDLHVNSLLQRLKRNLLLLLQLLTLALAALALMQPGIRGESGQQNRLVFLLDTSASMQATDVDGQENRFERARRLIGERIAAMSDSETAMLVTFSDRAETVQSFTSDRRRLREALSRVEVTNRPTDILGALKAADGLANPRRTSEVGNTMDVQVADAKPAQLLIYSDGKFPPATDFSVGNLVPEFIAVGTRSPINVGVTAFSAERNIEQPEQVQAYATVVNFGSAEVETTATLTLDGEFLDAETLQLEAGQSSGLSFSIESEDAATLRLELDVDDVLPIDNVAYAGLTPMRTVSVLVVTEANTPLRLGLSTLKAAKICTTTFTDPSYLESEDYATRAADGLDDLIIYDRCAPAEMPATNTFFIGALPPGGGDESDEESGTEDGADESAESGPPTTGWSWSGEPSQSILIDIDRTHPLMRYLELYSLLIFRGRGVEGPPGSTDLIQGDNGAILVLAPRDGYQDLVLGFEIITSSDDGSYQANTNWYTERSWPVFILNVLRYLAGAADASGAASHRPGETVRLRLENALGSVEVQRVGGESLTLPTGRGGITEIVETDTPGNYEVLSQGQLADLFAINLFDRTESDVGIAEQVDLGYESVDAQVGGEEVRNNYWRWALIAMLGLLAIEWWIYVKRVA